MRIRSILAGLILMLVALSASAVTRWFPNEAKRGTATFTTYPKIVINGQERMPGPGLRIWNTMNMIQFQTATKGENIAINYTEDAYKLIDRIWILTPTEAAQSLSGQQQSSSTITVTTPTKAITVTTSPTTTTVTSTSQTTTGN